MDIETFCLRARVRAETLRSWIEAGFVRAELDEADLARAELIRDLTEDLGVNVEGVEIVLDLLDQLYQARAALRRVLSVVGAADPALRERVLAALRNSG